MNERIRKFISTAAELFKTGDLVTVADRLSQAFPEVPDSVIVDYVFAHRREIIGYRSK